MNNLDQKVLGLEEILDDYQEQLENLYAKKDRIWRKYEEIEDELSNLRNLFHPPFHKKGKKIGLSKRTGLTVFALVVLNLLTAALIMLGVGDIILLLAHIIKINWLSSLIIPIIPVLVFVNTRIINKIYEKVIFYDNKISINIQLFGDTDYYADRIDDKKEILERRRLNLIEEEKMTQEQIGIIWGKRDELKSLLEAIVDYKGRFDEEINKVYESNMSQELKEKIDNHFVKVKK